MDDTANPENKRARALWDQAMALWVQPEIERRQEEGLLDKPFVLKQWQVVFFPGRTKPEVRLNEEAKIIVQFKLKKGRAVKKGEPIFADDVEDILLDTARLPDDEIDAGHISAFQQNEEWHLKFDFRYNKGKARSHIEAANEFLEMSKHALEKQMYIAFADTCFSAAELLAKAELLLIQQPIKDTHPSIQISYSKHVESGNAPEGFKDCLNRLAGYRTDGRYQKSMRKMGKDDASEFLDTVLEVKRHIENRL